MDDLISRQDAIRAVTTSDGCGRCEKVIKSIPSAQQWIPCSERLPDQNGKYLVVGRQKAINILKFDGGRWYGKWGVVAWMPLPDCYQGDENNKMPLPEPYKGESE